MKPFSLSLSLSLSLHTDSKTSYFKDLQCLVLPQFENKPIERGELSVATVTVATVTPADTYIDSVLAILNDMSIDKTIQANCMYLCGYYHIARGNVLRVRDRGRGRGRERERECE